MPTEQEIKNILSGFSEEYEYFDECFWQAFEITDMEEQEIIEEDAPSYIARYLLTGNFNENLRVFERKMYLALLTTSSNKTCETPAEITSFKKCCRQLKSLR